LHCFRCGKPIDEFRRGHKIDQGAYHAPRRQQKPPFPPFPVQLIGFAFGLRRS